MKKKFKLTLFFIFKNKFVFKKQIFTSNFSVMTLWLYFLVYYYRLIITKILSFNRTNFGLTSKLSTISK
tara:strand:- start:4332 stop:4538 length:207 start_codon:yes stop_codon:yes gene_type:complete